MKSGWIILDKDSGVFSRTAGGRIARMLGTKKFGHIGTLDPMATGVLPIAFGDATKMIPYIQEFHLTLKEYLFSLQFGFETDTLDITGREIARTDVIPDVDKVLSVLPHFFGDLFQTPPAYSAVHVNGRRAYEFIRSGQNPEIPERQVRILSLEFLGINGKSWHFRMRCSAGTYVRSVARDIAKMCGTLATVDMIRRTFSNGFSLEDTVKLDFLENLFNNSGDFGEYLKPTDYGLGDIPVCKLCEQDAKLYKNGGFISVQRPNGTRRVYCGKTFLGIGYIADGQLRPERTI